MPVKKKPAPRPNAASRGTRQRRKQTSARTSESASHGANSESQRDTATPRRSLAQVLMMEHDWIQRVAAEINPLMGGGMYLHGARIGSAERLARGPGAGSETACSLSEAAEDARMQLYSANRLLPGLLVQDYDPAMNLLDALANGSEERRAVLDAERLERVQRRILRANQLIRELVEHRGLRKMRDIMPAVLARIDASSPDEQEARTRQHESAAGLGSPTNRGAEAQGERHTLTTQERRVLLKLGEAGVVLSRNKLASVCRMGKSTASAAARSLVGLKLTAETAAGFGLTRAGQSRFESEK